MRPIKQPGMIRLLMYQGAKWLLVCASVKLVSLPSSHRRTSTLQSPMGSDDDDDDDDDAHH